MPLLQWLLKTLAPCKESYGKSRQNIKKQRHHFVEKCPSSQSYDFSSSHIQMWELDHKEGWVWKNWCFQTVVPEKALDSPLDCKGIKPVSPKGNRHWIFIGRTNAESEVPILWSSDQKRQLIGMDPDAGNDKEKEKTVTEDEMIRWHHQLDGHEVGQTLGDSEGWSVRHAAVHAVVELDTTEGLTTGEHSVLDLVDSPTISETAYSVLESLI